MLLMLIQPDLQQRTGASGPEITGNFGFSEQWRGGS